MSELKLSDFDLLGIMDFKCGFVSILGRPNVGKKHTSQQTCWPKNKHSFTQTSNNRKCCYGHFEYGEHAGYL